MKLFEVERWQKSRNSEESTKGNDVDEVEGPAILFPHSQRFDYGINISKAATLLCFLYRKGLVPDVSGPQRNGCPGTLIPLAVFGSCVLLCAIQVLECGVMQSF